MEIKPLLYILFVIIWLLYRQYNKATSSGGKSPAPKKKSVWEEILENIETGEPAPKVQKPVLHAKTVKHKVAPAKAKYESLEDMNTYNKVKRGAETAKTEQESLTLPADESSYEFNLRNAVIADAILNRPYK